MFRLNGLMADAIRAAAKQGNQTADLEPRVEVAFIEKSGFFFLRELHRPQYENLVFDDEVGYECFVNDIFYEHGKNNLCLIFHFTHKVQRAFKAQIRAKELLAIISLDREYAKLKFHAFRAGQDWLSRDLRGYQQPVCVFSCGGVKRFLARHS